MAKDHKKARDDIDSRFEERVVKVRTIIQSRGFITRRELMRRMWPPVNVKQLSRLVGVLVEAGFVTAKDIPRPGGTTVLYSWTG